MQHKKWLQAQRVQKLENCADVKFFPIGPDECVIGNVKRLPNDKGYQNDMITRVGCQHQMARTGNQAHMCMYMPLEHLAGWVVRHIGFIKGLQFR